MAKFRLAVERRQERPDHPNDLRGLGTSGLLDEHFPWVYLAVHGAHADTLEKSLQSLNLRSKVDPSTNCHILFDARKDKSHRQKSLNLFGAALLTSHFEPNAHMMLGQIDILRLQMETLPLPENPEFNATEYMNWSQHASAGLKLFSPVTMHLAHAGFAISEHSETLHLSSKDLVSLATFEATTHFARKAA